MGSGGIGPRLLTAKARADGAGLKRLGYWAGPLPALYSTSIKRGLSGEEKGADEDPLSFDILRDWATTLALRIPVTVLNKDIGFWVADTESVPCWGDP